MDKLGMEDYKIYLKRFGLRLSGNKEVLLERIKEHMEVRDGGGERKYPISGFVINCKGDACKGDVVMFKQNISKKKDQNGTRTIAGRIVSESYGAEKQQHTFTIEVLWCKGKKRLPSLYPLRIKGRNLYKLKTMRQRWDNEEEREKILQEKHNRGDMARISREQRILERETRKIQRQNRMDIPQNSRVDQVNNVQRPARFSKHDVLSDRRDPFLGNKTSYSFSDRWDPQRDIRSEILCDRRGPHRDGYIRGHCKFSHDE